MFDLGSSVFLEADLTDPYGAPVDGSGVAGTVQLPDGTTAALSIAHPSVGTYTATYVPLSVGHYAWKITGTGANAFAKSDVFNVSPAFSGALISTSDARAQLNEDGHVDDAEIQQFVRDATAVVNSKCGYSVPTTVTETVSVPPRGSLEMVLTYGPLLSITSITPLTLGVPVPDLTHLDPDLSSGVLRLNYGYYGGFNGQFYGRYTVTYRVGRACVPDALQGACALIAANLFETQRGGAVAIPGMGGDGEYTPAYSPPIPDRAALLMEPYLLGPSI